MGFHPSESCGRKFRSIPSPVELIVEVGSALRNFHSPQLHLPLQPLVACRRVDPIRNICPPVNIERGTSVPKIRFNYRTILTNRTMSVAVTTTAAPLPVVSTPAVEIDLAMSILTILTSLCASRGPKAKSSAECIRAQNGLLALAEKTHTPYVVRGSSDPVLDRSDLERAILSLLTESQVTGLIDRNRAPTSMATGLNWGVFFRALKSILSLTAKIVDPSELIQKIRDHLLTDPSANLDQLKIALEFHLSERLGVIMSTLDTAERKFVYLIVGLSLFLLISTCCWLALNLRTYLSQRKLRKAQKATRQAGFLLREIDRRGRGRENADVDRHLI